MLAIARLFGSWMSEVVFGEIKFTGCYPIVFQYQQQ
jgi:hypothetical protein